MKCIIFEDEQPAASRLQKLIQEIDPAIQVIEVLDSIKSGIHYLQTNKTPDLIFSDIHLADGLSFEIFSNVKTNYPVIFTTAYEQYAINAFKLNSVDYLLKPIKKEDLSYAISKYQSQFKKAPLPASVDYASMMDAIQSVKKDYQKRIVIRFGDTIKTIEIDDIAYFYTENKINFLCSKTSQNYPVDFNLDELEQILNPKLFYRINRQFIVNINAIQKMVVVSKSRVKLTLFPGTALDTIVSTERSSLFKEWLAGA